jgi:hypothetical protein
VRPKLYVERNATSACDPPFASGLESPFPDAIGSSFIHAVARRLNDLDISKTSVGFYDQRKRDLALCPGFACQVGYLAGVLYMGDGGILRRPLDTLHQGV